MMTRHWIQILTITTILLLPQFATHTNSQGDSLRSLRFFATVSSTLDASSTRHIYEFEGARGQVVSVLASTITGDLDPVIEIHNTAGQIMVANDNATFDTTDAIIEGFALPENDRYLIHIYREGLQRGQTAGSYELSLLQGYALFDEETPTAFTTTESTEQTLGTFDSLPFYMSHNLRMAAAEDSYRMRWEIIDPTTVSWVFEHNPAGVWTLSLQNAAGETVRTIEGKDNALPGPNESTDLTFWRDESQLQIIAGQTVLATMNAIDNLIATQPGQISLSVNQSDAPLSLISNFHITSSFYSGRTALDAGAIGPTPAGQRIYNYESDPRDVMVTLRGLGYAPPPTGTSGIQGDIFSSFILNDAASFNAYPLVARQFNNFVLSFGAKMNGASDGTACGMIFRQVSSATFATVLFTPARGLYALQYEDGNLIQGGISTISTALLPGNDTVNHFIIIATDDRAEVFVNGRLVGEFPVLDVAGFTLSHLALDRDIRVLCDFENIWLWSFD